MPNIYASIHISKNTDTCHRVGKSDSGLYATIHLGDKAALYFNHLEDLQRVIAELQMAEDAFAEAQLDELTEELKD